MRPLLGRVKGAGLSRPAVLRAAGGLDRMSVFLQRRPVLRLLLLLYVALVHLLWLFF